MVGGALALALFGLVLPRRQRRQGALQRGPGTHHGYLFVRRVSTRGFETAALVATALGGALLLVR
ncbi:MAG TPA: hypothetical protein VHM65_09670 [Candidatus Lustribacter sp.]|nr:hypothetical protein [Candidatus Lustribacter sp.]